MTYFFKGDKYWKFKNKKAQDGYPKKIGTTFMIMRRYHLKSLNNLYSNFVPIAKGFDGIPNNLDAAFVWGGNGKIYFFKVIIVLFAKKK